MIVVAGFSETPILFYQTTRRPVPDATNWRVIPLTWSAEVRRGAVHRDAAVFTGTAQRRLVPHSVVHTARRGFHFHPTRAEVKVQIDVSIEQLESEEIRLQHKPHNGPCSSDTRHSGQGCW